MYDSATLRCRWQGVKTLSNPMPLANPKKYHSRNRSQVGRNSIYPRMV